MLLSQQPVMYPNFTNLSVTNMTLNLVQRSSTVNHFHTLELSPLIIIKAWSPFMNQFQQPPVSSWH